MQKFNTADAVGIARRAFGIDATASALPGEYDQNFELAASDGARYLLKIARAGEPPEALAFQEALMAHLASRAPDLPLQRCVPTFSGDGLHHFVDDSGAERLIRCLTYLPGRLLAHVSPHTPELLSDLGRTLGRMDAALVGFSHPYAERDLKWDLSRAEWIRGYTQFIGDGARRSLVECHLDRYQSAVQPALGALRRGVAHNDANDYNVLVEGTGYDARISGLIDFGDAIDTPTVCNLAIALAYAMLGKPDPLASASRVVAGYHAENPLAEAELAVLYELAVMRLVVSVTNSAHRAAIEPDDPYITISEMPAWATLERLASVHPRLAHYKLRSACGYPAVPHAQAVADWMRTHARDVAAVVAPDPRRAPALVFDLSVGSLDVGLEDEVDTTAKFSRRLFDAMDAAGAQLGVGRYDEPRLIYANDDFATTGENGAEYRTVHIGFDLFLAAGQPVFAPLDGTVHSLRDNAARLDYGPCIILEHTPNGRDGAAVRFYTLYGHLSRESLSGLAPGQAIARGQRFATIGDYPENGDWPPHLHFQVITDLLDFQGTFPGVARPSDRDVWTSLCPDPNLMCGVPGRAFPPAPMRDDAILVERRARIGRNLSLSYRRPLHMVRGRGQYLYDEAGRRFLDGYNNVPHVGHSHPDVVRAGQRQMAVLNTNTRYLHDNLVRYAARLTAALPPPLSVCFLVSSGSEATELAVRLARAHTGQRDLIVSEGAYHGHTSTLIDISPYKAEGPGGKGLPDWVHKAELPDTYRGRFKRDDPAAGRKYAAGLRPIVDSIQRQGRGLSGFLIESIPSVGGQIVLPDGYLTEAYTIVREAGGVCMADEVQTGFGRIGSHFWAFQAQGVVPDIVALGKPIGNGHPMGAVVTTPEIAASFDNGMEFFATFGGNPVSCAIGLAVLDVLERERLQDHARELGGYFLEQLRLLMAAHPVIGDVRGLGLMLGAELVLDRRTLEPAPRQAAYVCDRMRDRGILIGTDGLHHNVLKIRGPLVLSRADVDFFIAQLDEVLAEDGARP